MRLPTRIGVEYPSPTVIFHRCVSVSGHTFGSVNAVNVPSRRGPRHCGQSCPELVEGPCALIPTVNPASTNVPISRRCDVFMLSSQVRLKADTTGNTPNRITMD